MANRSLMLKLLSAFLIFGAWEIAGRIPVSYAFPPFSEAMIALGKLALNGALWVAYAETLKPLIVGVAISTVFGIGLGVWIGLSKFFDWLVSPIFIVMQSAPLAALIPLLVMAYGIGLTSKVFVVCIMAMPVIVRKYQGDVQILHGHPPRHAAEDHYSRGLAADLLGAAARRIGRVHRRHPVGVENYPHRRRRHHHLQPIHRRLSQHVCGDLFDHRLGGSVPEPAGADGKTTIQRK